MTQQELRSFFTPYIRAVYPSCERGGPDTLFVGEEGLTAWAGLKGLTLRDAMRELLSVHIWPERFRRNYGLFSVMAMRHMLKSRILLLGCGGLGGHVAALLARMGVGMLRLCDYDVFDESNLNRQYFAQHATLGKGKAATAADGLRAMASHMDCEVIAAPASDETLPALVAGMDLAVDCLDSIPLKLALERAALRGGVPFVHGSVLREEGFAFLSLKEERLPSLYPHSGRDEDEKTRAQAMSGIAAAGIACLMAQLCARHLCRVAEGREPTASPLYHLDYSVPELESFFS